MSRTILFKFYISITFLSKIEFFGTLIMILTLSIIPENINIENIKITINILDIN